MANIDLLEDLLSGIVRPLANTALQVINHPVDTAASVLTCAADAVQAHPYACAALVGLGAYTHHRGWWKVNGNRLQINLDLDVGVLGAYKTNTTLRLGPR